MSTLTKAELARIQRDGFDLLARIEVLEAEQERLIQDARDHNRVSDEEGERADKAEAAVALLTREVGEAQRELERRGRAVSDAMGKYRRHEPLIEAVGRLANDYHNAMVQVERLTARAEALEAVLGLVQAWWDDVYPAAIFTGVSGDEGALRVAEVRAALQRLKERQG